MSFDLDFVETFQWFSFLGFMALSIAVLARDHAHQIAIIWYINTLFFVFFVCIGFAAESSNVRLTEVCGSYEDTCKHIYKMLISLDDEVNLLLFGLALAIVPQLLTYVFGILSGSAATPRYVSLAGKIAFWSWIKFIAGLAGISSAAPFATWLAGKPVSVESLFAGIIYISFAFVFAAIYVLLTERIPAVIKAWSGKVGDFANRFVTRIHKFATRNLPATPEPHPHSLTRQALIQFLKSDAVYDYVVQDKPKA
ncbi:hypothetical protein [Bradyrhizobium australiense]|uniref:Uncharacterized protein n=1 Tax=Bradyrhizobium australiense TaxID=2721161 RepID=A0A7Y4GSG3_9BRAD|nr:hypothetical protein [Bradyrhizobium australiense]NOJ40897.1 hypothetical protein [Bradyrhizobium australiense]